MESVKKILKYIFHSPDRSILFGIGYSFDLCIEEIQTAIDQNRFVMYDNTFVENKERIKKDYELHMALKSHEEFKKRLEEDEKIKHILQAEGERIHLELEKKWQLKQQATQDRVSRHYSTNIKLAEILSTNPSNIEHIIRSFVSHLLIHLIWNDEILYDNVTYWIYHTIVVFDDALRDLWTNCGYGHRRNQPVLNQLLSLLEKYHRKLEWNVYAIKESYYKASDKNQYITGLIHTTEKDIVKFISLYDYRCDSLDNLITVQIVPFSGRYRYTCISHYSCICRRNPLTLNYSYATTIQNQIRDYFCNNADEWIWIYKRLIILLLCINKFDTTSLFCVFPRELMLKIIFAL